MGQPDLRDFFALWKKIAQIRPSQSFPGLRELTEARLDRNFVPKAPLKPEQIAELKSSHRDEMTFFFVCFIAMFFGRRAGWALSMSFKESYKQSKIRYGENAAARELPPLPSLRIEA